MQLSSISFNTFFGDIMIASVESVGQVLLAPSSTSSLSLSGRLLPQQSPAGLSAVSTVFDNFLHGMDSNIIVQGAGAAPAEVTKHTSL
jgi:hypothetical protein